MPERTVGLTPGHLSKDSSKVLFGFWNTFSKLQEFQTHLEEGPEERKLSCWDSAPTPQHTSTRHQGYFWGQSSSIGTFFLSWGPKGEKKSNRECYQGNAGNDSLGRKPAVSLEVKGRLV